MKTLISQIVRKVGSAMPARVISKRIFPVALALMLVCVPSAWAITGPQALGANPFAFGIVRISINSDLDHSQWVCTGTLVGSSWVLTSVSCAAALASETSVSMQNTSDGSVQSSNVREVVKHPSLDLALLLLSTPMTPANRNIFPEVLTTRPANGRTVVCYGFGGGFNNALNNAPFGVSGGGDNYSVSSSNAFQAGDQGGPCFDGSVGSNYVQRIVGVISQPSQNLVISGVGVKGTGADGEFEQDTVQQWIADMIHLDPLKWLNYSHSLINKNSNKAFDVANGSLLPNTAVNQYHLNGGLNQNWFYDFRSGDYPFGRMVSAQSGKCLDVDGSYRLRQSTCSSATTQLFRIIRVDPAYANVVAFDGQVVDVPSFSTADGTRLQTYPWNGGANQLWYQSNH